MNIPISYSLILNNIYEQIKLPSIDLSKLPTISQDTANAIVLTSLVGLYVILALHAVQSTPKKREYTPPLDRPLIELDRPLLDLIRDFLILLIHLRNPGCYRPCYRPHYYPLYPRSPYLLY